MPDLAELSNIVPLGGASVLLIYLLRIIQVERQRWIDERATLIKEHKEEEASRELERNARYIMLKTDYDIAREELEKCRRHLRDQAEEGYR